MITIYGGGAEGVGEYWPMFDVNITTWLGIYQLHPPLYMRYEYVFWERLNFWAGGNKKCGPIYYIFNPFIRYFCF